MTTAYFQEFSLGTLTPYSSAASKSWAACLQALNIATGQQTQYALV